MSNLIIQFRHLPKIGLLSFNNLSDNSQYIFFSNKLHTLLCTHLCRLQGNTHENALLQDAYNQDLIQLSIVKSYVVDPGTVIMRADYDRAIFEVRSLGNKDMREGYRATGYKIKKYVLNDFRAGLAGAGPLVYVCGKSPSLGDIVLAIFNNIPVAEEWIELTYGKSLNDVIPVFIDNEYTTAYRKLYGDRLCY